MVNQEAEEVSGTRSRHSLQKPLARVLILLTRLCLLGLKAQQSLKQQGNKGSEV